MVNNIVFWVLTPNQADLLKVVSGACVAGENRGGGGKAGAEEEERRELKEGKRECENRRKRRENRDGVEI